MRAYTKGPYLPAAHCLQSAPAGVREPNQGITLPTERDRPAPGRNAPLAHARALLIYLKHRGVLNIEEFRRTSSRGA